MTLAGGGNTKHTGAHGHRAGLLNRRCTSRTPQEAVLAQHGHPSRSVHCVTRMGQGALRRIGLDKFQALDRLLGIALELGEDQPGELGLSHLTASLCPWFAKGVESVHNHVLHVERLSTRLSAATLEVKAKQSKAKKSQKEASASFFHEAFPLRGASSIMAR
jgi:hypothetical protein